ncbi:hypothetical protein [Pseudarthrobacter sp. Y6]|uniref:hypothetical protein n=1 Tax=Pseudarthrobacter sp. Y6 TaxID=3418422 RepID=UPI003CE8ACF1
MSRTDAVAIMAVAAIVAAATTFLTVWSIIATFVGPVTLALPLHSSPQDPAGLELDATARFTAMEATIPALPLGEAALLAWASVLFQVSVLAVAALLFLLALRLRGENLFTPASAWIVGSCGVVLALAASAGQVLDAIARAGVARLIAANGQTDGVILAADFNFAPLLAGIVLVLIAGVFQFGRRLQKDTEGLV